MIRFSKTYPSFLTVKEGVLLRSSHPSLLIKRAALGNLKASFHCTHWHRFFPIKKAFFYLSVSPARKDFFRKPTRPSLPLRKAPPLISVFSPQARRRKPPYSVLFFRFPPSPFSQRELHLQPSLPPQKEGCKPPYSVLGTAAL